MTSAPSLKLYSYFRSSASYRVRAALNYKKIPYTLIPINLLKKEHHIEEYHLKNPNKLLPTLEVNNGGGDLYNLTQSLSILEWIEENSNLGIFGEEAKSRILLSNQSKERAKIRSLSQIIACDTQPIQNLRVLQKVKQDYNADANEWATHWIRLGFTAIEEMSSSSTSNNSSNFLLNTNNPTVADICVLAQCYNARRFGINMEKEFPLITNMESAMLNISEIRNAHPHMQMDCLEELKGVI